MNNVKLCSLSSRQFLAAEETHSFAPTFVNAIRCGFNHEAVNNNQSTGAINPVAADSTLGSFAGRNAAQVQITGNSLMPGGVGGLPTYLYRWNSFQVYDDAFLNRGKHAIKLGVAVERMLMQATALTDPRGILPFADVLSSMTNHPATLQGGF